MLPTIFLGFVQFLSFLLSTSLGEELLVLLHEPFDKGPEQGVVGQAGRNYQVDAPGHIDLERGTFAFFIKSAEDPAETEWAQLAGVNSIRGDGYWSMILGFDLRLKDFVFSFYDAGRYAPPLKLPSAFGRWKAGQWHHLAAAWDRQQGASVYEDGRRVASHWGQHRWEWNLAPQKLFVHGVVDELYVYANPLTDEQVTQLARGEKPSGPPVPLETEEAQRPRELARMGWAGESLEALPRVEAGKPLEFTFARITRCVDAKRPVAEPFEGFAHSTWPLVKYGASIRGQRLDIYLASGASYDRARVLLHRPFSGGFVRPAAAGQEEMLLALESDQAVLWHRRLPFMLHDEHVALKRKTGWLGQIDFYRAEPMRRRPSSKKLLAFGFSRAASFPESELGMAIRAETPTRFQQPALATATAAASASAWTLSCPAFGGFQAMTEPMAEAQAFDGAIVRLVASNLTQATPVRIRIKEPVEGWRDWLIADAVLEPRGTGKQTFTLLLRGRPVINMPAAKVRPGGPFKDLPGGSVGLTITAAHPVEWVMGEGGCSLQLHRADFAQALPAAADDQVEFMREAYAEVMEGHQYSDKRLVIPMMWLARLAPERMEFRQMYERIGSPQWFEGISVPPLVYTPPKNITGAPEWAFWQMEAMKEHRRLLHWIIDNQQLWNGEFGGIWNDDTDHTENWYCHAMAMDDDGKIANSLRLFCDGLWNYQLEQGVGKYTMDACHFYEEGMGSQAMRILLDYGEPVAVERVMAAASHYDKWMRQLEDGRYIWISEYVSVHGAWTYGAFGRNPGYGGHKWDLMLPAGYLIWYSRHPEAARYYRGLEGIDWFHGSARDRVTDFAKARERYARDALQPLGRYGPKTHLVYIDEIGLPDEVRKAHGVEYKPAGPIAHYWGARDTDDHWFRFKITGDIRFLIDSYRRVCEWFYSHDWLNTAAMPSMDRNPLPRYSLIRARIGSLATNRGASGLTWPLYGLSYVRGASDIAALVTENLDNRLTVRFYAFPEKPHEVECRLWRLHPGTYRVCLYPDRDDDGKPDAPSGGAAALPLLDKGMTFDRGAYLRFTLPPRQCSILAVTPVQTSEPDYDRPDPAISEKTVELVYGEHLVVRVHNLGNKPVENLLVRVRDARSSLAVVMGEQRIDRIEAPLDLKPKVRGVEFKNINANTYGKILIELDPEGEINDLNRYNNRVELRY